MQIAPATDHGFPILRLAHDDSNPVIAPLPLAALGIAEGEVKVLSGKQVLGVELREIEAQAAILRFRIARILPAIETPMHHAGRRQRNK